MPPRSRVFGVRVDGSVRRLHRHRVAFALLTGSFGLLIAAIGRTPEATRGLAILATLLMVMLGGAWVPAFIFPEWLQNVSLFVPTRWAVDGLDAMTWRGLASTMRCADCRDARLRAVFTPWRSGVSTGKSRAAERAAAPPPSAADVKTPLSVSRQRRGAEIRRAQGIRIACIVGAHGWPLTAADRSMRIRNSGKLTLKPWKLACVSAST